jgi:glucose/mannose-6-phosphate isomerase
MNLDDIKAFEQIDSQNMMAHIDGLPDQLQTAWQLGMQHPLPDWKDIHNVVIAGMGGSAIGGDLLAAYTVPLCRVPILLHRDYGLPAWAQGPETLVIASSHSGNTEETLSSFEIARSKGCRVLTVSTGGALADAAHQAGYPTWHFDHHGQPRSAVGFSFGLLLAAMARLELIPDPAADLKNAIAEMKNQQASIKVDVPVVGNPAKRMAGQLMGRWVMVIGADAMAPVARRWKSQINEIAKAWAQFDVLPEADHNTVAGLVHPQEVLPRMMALFLRGPADHPRQRLRLDLTRKTFMVEGINTDTIDAQGNTPLANQWTSLHFGDYAAYYLAMAYEIDPTPIELIRSFKEAMLAAGS